MNIRFNLIPLDKKKSMEIKGWLAVFVVLHHISQQVSSFWIVDIFESLGRYIVAMFFFMSGYGLLESFKKRKNYLDGFLKDRLIKIGIPFFYAVLLFQLFQLFSNNDFSFIGIFTPLISGSTRNLLPFSWYVFASLFTYFLFYAVFSNTKHSVLFSSTMVFFILVGYSFLCKVLGFGYWWYQSIFAFYIGIVFRENERKLNNDVYHVFVLILSVVGISIISGHDDITTLAIFPVAIFLFFSVIKIPDFRIFEYLGKISYEVYLFQGVSIFFLRSNLVWIENSEWYVFFVILLTFFLAIIFHKISAFTINSMYRI